MQRTLSSLPRVASPRRAGLARPALLSRTVSIAWVQLAMLFGALMALPFTRLVDNDFWWHLRTGELIANSGIPRHDPFSWTAAGRPWVAHEWLSELVIYSVQSVFGYAGNVLLFGAVAISALTIAYALGRRAGAGTRPLVGMMLLAALVFGAFITVRPQAFTWLFFAAFLYILAADSDDERAPLWYLPPLMAIWANLHLGFVYGFVLIGCWLAAHCWRAVRGSPRSLRKPLLVAACCLLAACANPDGPALLWYPLRYLTDGSVANAHVAEWQRPDITQPFHAPIFLVALALGAAVISRGRPKPFLLLVSLAVLALSMKAVRNAPFAALVAIPVCSAAMASRWQGARNAADSGMRMSLGVALLLVAGTAAIVGPLELLQSGAGVSLTAPSERGYPEAGAEYVKANLAGRRLFNGYSSGGYLIYKLDPDVPVFIDGRSDFYGDGLMKDYFVLYRAEPGWEAMLDRYGIDAALIPDNTPLAAALSASPLWEHALDAERESVFVRR